MRARVGVALSRDAVRAVAIRRNRIVWAAEAPLPEDRSPLATLEALLAAAPLPRFPAPIFSAAVGPHASQVRLISGLPESSSAATAGAIIRENTSAFFLKDGVPLVATRVQITKPNRVFAAAIDQPYVDAARTICHARGWQLGFIAPAMVCLGRAFEDQAFVWVDGGCVVEVVHIDGTLESIRTRPLSAVESIQTSPPRLVPQLRALGDNAERFADAYAVAATLSPPVLSLDSESPGFWPWKETRRRLVLPGSLLAVGALAIVMSPLSAVIAGHRAQGRLSGIREDQIQTVVSTLDMLDRTAAVLDEARGFAISRQSVIALLGELADKLPAGTVLVSLELTDSVCQLGAITANPADVFGVVGKLPGAHSVAFLGPIQHEALRGHELQRVTVRWTERAQ
jgi:hypothetical protein